MLFDFYRKSKCYYVYERYTIVPIQIFISNKCHPFQLIDSNTQKMKELLKRQTQRIVNPNKTWPLWFSALLMDFRVWLMSSCCRIYVATDVPRPAGSGLGGTSPPSPRNLAKKREKYRKCVKNEKLPPMKYDTRETCIIIFQNRSELWKSDQNWKTFSETFNFRLRFLWKTTEFWRILSKNFNFLLNLSWKKLKFSLKCQFLLEYSFQKVNSIFIIHSSNFKDWMWIPSRGLPPPPCLDPLHTPIKTFFHAS